MRPGDGDDREWRTVPRPVKEGLDNVARRLGAPEATALAAVFSGWERAVGATVAANARPVRLIDGTLLVAVEQPGWATQLRYLAADLVRRLTEVAGAGVVTAIEIKVEGASAPPRRPPFTPGRRGRA